MSNKSIDMNMKNHPSNQLLIDLVNCISITPKDAG
jgi:hypothetical protein